MIVYGEWFLGRYLVYTLTYLDLSLWRLWVVQPPHLSQGQPHLPNHTTFLVLFDKTDIAFVPLSMLMGRLSI
jgi:hypothetical protein